MRRIDAIAMMTGVLAVCLLCRAEEWPKWRGPEGTGISTEKNIADSWPAGGPRKIWSRNVGIGFSSPIALEGKIYLFTQEDSRDVLRAMDADSGKVIWEQSYERGYDPAYPGTRATPTIDSGRIYTYGSAGHLTCRELADGKLVWQTNVLHKSNGQPTNWGEASSPLVTDQLVYVQGGSGDQPIAVAVDKQSGAIFWRSEARGVSGYAAPILIDVDHRKELIVLGGEVLFGMDAKSGNTLWSLPWQTDFDVNAATPLFDSGHLFITSGYGHGSMMLEVTGAGVRKMWEQNGVACKFQAPILDGGVLYANSGGTLMCLSWPDGRKLWEARDHNLRLGDGGSMVRNGDKLIVMSERGKLSLVHATPEQYKIVSQVPLFDYDKVWSTPLIYRGKLYAKGRDELVCLDIGSAKP